MIVTHCSPSPTDTVFHTASCDIRGVSIHQPHCTITAIYDYGMEKKNHNSGNLYTTFYKANSTCKLMCYNWTLFNHFQISGRLSLHPQGVRSQSHQLDRVSNQVGSAPVQSYSAPHQDESVENLPHFQRRCWLSLLSMLQILLICWWLAFMCMCTV